MQVLDQVFISNSIKNARRHNSISLNARIWSRKLIWCAERLLGPLWQRRYQIGWACLVRATLIYVCSCASPRKRIWRRFDMRLKKIRRRSKAGRKSAWPKRVLRLSLYLSLHVYLSIYLSIYLYLSIYQSLSLYIYVCVSLSLSISLSLPFSPSLALSLSVSLFRRIISSSF